MTETRAALLIASQQYEDKHLSQLVAPAQDAQALIQVLENPEIGGFEARSLINEPAYRVIQAIEEFFEDRKRDDLLLLYFSGHGVRDKQGQLYFAAPNTRRTLLRSTAIPAATVNDIMRHSRPKQQVLLLDCCYSGAFAKGFKSQDVLGSSVGINEQLGARGRVVMTASSALQYAFEGDEIKGQGVRSVFTDALVKGLESGRADLDGDGQISLGELYDFVFDTVTAATPGQTPEKSEFGVQGNIVIARNPNPVVKPAKLPLELQDSLEDRRPWVREGALHEVARLLDGSNPGMALAARGALEQLTSDDSRAVSSAAVEILKAHPQSPGESVVREVVAEPVLTPQARPKPQPSLNPSLRLLLSAKPQNVDIDKEVKWTVTLTNDGDDNLRHLTVRQGRTLLDDPFDLAAGKGRRFTFSTTHKTAGKKRYTVTATGISSDGKLVDGKAAASIHVLAPSPGASSKEVVKVDVNRAGKTLKVPLIERGEQLSAIDNVPIVWDIDGKEMVSVSAGEFLYGDKNESLYLPDYWIDKTPVTNAEYARFVDATGHKAPVHWRGFARKGKALPDKLADHPVVNVTLLDALAYAKWAGKSLPTEQEWEKAARGKDGQGYPWGNRVPGPDQCNFAGNVKRTTPVGRYSPQGDSPYGCVDMSGNVWEWTPKYILRGGSFSSSAGDIRAAARLPFPNEAREFIGFRTIVGAENPDS